MEGIWLGLRRVRGDRPGPPSRSCSSTGQWEACQHRCARRRAEPRPTGTV